MVTFITRWKAPELFQILKNTTLLYSYEWGVPRMRRGRLLLSRMKVIIYGGWTCLFSALN